jgi:tetratricopeptide (TPR) repeat protein
LREVGRALLANDMATALRVSRQAISNGVEHPQLLVFAAFHELAMGSPRLALQFAQRARALGPGSADALNAEGACLARLSRFREAIKAFDAALRAAPGDRLIRFNKASALESLQELSRARIEYERVVEAQPDHVDALTNLAGIAMQRGDVEAARNFAERALRINPRHDAAFLELAGADIEDQKFETALVRLDELLQRKTLSAKQLSVAQGLTGDAYDGLGRTADAFRCYAQSQATRRAAYAPQFERPDIESAAALVRRLMAYFRAAPRDSWQASAGSTQKRPVATHVFLVGFPRSGTTLLEQILAGHPDIEVMSERSCLIDAQERFTLPPDGLDRLSKLSGPELTPFRDAYWSCVAAEGSRTRRGVFVDKMPFYCVFLCLVAKLFPGAKIIFALRDPRDVVLSCFRRRFVMTEQMYELTTLESAASHFDAVMGLCERYRERLGLSFCDVRHENLVADIEKETRRLCAFLGIPWNAAMTRFDETARHRLANTPSGPQLARGLSSKSMGQWRRYREHLAPVLPKLAPWVAHLGYPEI